MNIVEKIKQSHMHNKLPILILFAYCFYLDLLGLVSGFFKVYNLINELVCFISIILFGVYIIFYFRRKKFTVLPFIAVVLRCANSIFAIITLLSNYKTYSDSTYLAYMSLMCSLASLIGYCLLAYCAFCGFKKKKLLVISVIIIFIVSLFNYIYSIVSGYYVNMYAKKEDIFVILLLIFGLTNSIYPVVTKEEEYDYVTFMLNDLDYKRKEGIITEDECKKLKKEIIDSL